MAGWAPARVERILELHLRELAQRMGGIVGQRRIATLGDARRGIGQAFLVKCFQ